MASLQEQHRSLGRETANFCNEETERSPCLLVLRTFAVRSSGVGFVSCFLLQLPIRRETVLGGTGGQKAAKFTSLVVFTTLSSARAGRPVCPDQFVYNQTIMQTGFTKPLQDPIIRVIKSPE